MKQLRLLFFFLVIATTFSSCEIIGDIFKAGIWVGVVIVVLIIMLFVWLMNKLRRRRRY